MNDHIDTGYMCIDALRGRYRLKPSDIGEDALMKAKGMTFTTGSYEVEGLGHLCVLRMKAFAGLMKMETAVLAVRSKDMPLLNIDWMSVAGSETQIIELYDVQLEDYPAEKLDSFAKTRTVQGGKEIIMKAIRAKKGLKLMERTTLLRRILDRLRDIINTFNWD